jgi:Protein of unknown function (DUF3152)
MRNVAHTGLPPLREGESSPAQVDHRIRRQYLRFLQAVFGASVSVLLLGAVVVSESSIDVAALSFLPQAPVGSVSNAAPHASNSKALAKNRKVNNRNVKIGPQVLYAVRVDPDTGVDPSEVALIVDQTLRDPRSWQPLKRTVFVATGWSKATLKIRVRTPKNTDRSCAPFKTARVKSCSRNWEVFINSDRWLFGAVPSQMSLDDYRRYVVNHEVGHSLGQDHVPCSSPGAVASVMLQQTVGLDGCLPNPWPNP